MLSHSQAVGNVTLTYLGCMLTKDGFGMELTVVEVGRQKLKSLACLALPLWKINSTQESSKLSACPQQAFHEVLLNLNHKI